MAVTTIHLITGQLPPTGSASSEFDVPIRKARLLPLDGKSPMPCLKRRSFAESHRGCTILPNPLQLLVSQPQVLTTLLDHLPWVYFYALTCTCRDFRYTLRDPDLKDVVFAQYVPGYRSCIGFREIQRFEDVPATISHLCLLLISQQVPLHRYPIHALAYTSALWPSKEQEDITQKLKSLAQAHSRFVLLLQSIVHSSSIPISTEPEDGLRLGPSKPGLRELTFPAPLSLLDHVDSHTVSEVADTIPPPRGHKHYRSASSFLGGSNSLAASRPRILKNPFGDVQSSPDSRALTSLERSAGRKSVWRRTARPPPPPSIEPRSLKFYSATWRRRVSGSLHSGGEFTSDEDFLLRNSCRRFASVNASRASSFSHSIDLLRSSSSPHDLQLAMSRSRAPILRVFVPCSDMHEHVIAACEEQLVQSGLWEHLSTGDIICNLGFVPPALEDNGSDSDGHASASERDASGRSTSRKWLLFDGCCLVPFSPPESPPLDDPLTLPSPFYYSHIMSPFANQTYRLSLPPSPFEEVPQTVLVYTSSKVKSPHSPGGYATVKKYMWVARLAWTSYSRFPDGETIGQGWLGEWVLEGEGTREGRRILIDCIEGRETEQQEWELVREKSGGGRIWIRLLNAASVPSSEASTCFEDTLHAP